MVILISGIYTVFDNSEWEEIPNRQINSAGVVFAGKNNVGKEVKLFIKRDKKQD